MFFDFQVAGKVHTAAWTAVGQVLSSFSRAGVTPHWVVSASYSSRASAGDAGAAGAKQQVAGSVRGVDELHHVDLVAVSRSSDARSESVRTSAKRSRRIALPGQLAVRRRGRVRP